MRLLLCLAILLVPAFAVAGGVDDDARPFVNVTGEGEISVVPDKATISVTISGEAKQLSDAKQQADFEASKLNGIIKLFKIEDKDVKTQTVRINPQYDYIRPEGRVFKGYQVQQQFSVTFENIGNVGTFMHQLVEGGIDQVGGVQFGLQDYEMYRQKAIKLAVINARERAEKAAEAADILLDKDAFAIKVGGGPGMPHPPVFAEALAMRSDMSAAPQQVSPGEMVVREVVNVTYLIDQEGGESAEEEETE